MQFEHKILTETGKTVVYLNVYIEDKTEAAKEFLSRSSNGEDGFKNKIKEYIKNKIGYIKGATIVIAVNGILIGALTMNNKNNLEIYGENNFKDSEVVQVLNEDLNENFIKASKVKIYEENDVQNLQNVDKEEENSNEITETKNETKNEINQTNKNSVSVAVKEVKEVKVNNNNVNENVQNEKVSITEDNAVNTVEENVEAEEKIEETKESNENTETNAKENKMYISLSTNGNIQQLELEEYITGVVAAEMPASFNVEALKAQAIAARTYAVKKTSAGKTLKNSTSDQVYKTIEQMKTTWGSDFAFYYDKVQTAVNDTKGLVLTYNGEYIDAQYSAITNGKTEMPDYVWSYSRPYLQCVSSEWDENVKNFEVTKSFTYSEVSSALGQEITKNTNIEVLSRTSGDRVNVIKIGDVEYAGTKVRSLLGLRSADFEIKLNEDNVTITTKGYGHGVGMSQYGANGAANSGYTYSQILKHYYVGVDITSIY